MSWDVRTASERWLVELSFTRHVTVDLSASKITLSWSWDVSLVANTEIALNVAHGAALERNDNGRRE